MSRLVYILNVRISDEIRLNRLLNLIGNLSQDASTLISLRIRGTYAESFDWAGFAVDIPVQLYINSSFQEWKLDLLEQVTRIDSDHYFLIQEDHALLASTDLLKRVLLDVEQNNIDFLPLSFHPHYQNFVKNLHESNSEEIIAPSVSSWALTRRVLRGIPMRDRNYPVSLLGLYSRSLLIKIICSEFPLYKQYSVESPFNFEQNPSRVWYLPIRWGFPKQELFACIDDNHDIAGYSLHARGLATLDGKRRISHHDQNSILDSPGEKTNQIKSWLISFLPSFVSVIPRNYQYSKFSLRSEIEL